MVTIKAGYRQPSIVIPGVAFGALCLAPVVFQMGAFPEFMGLGCLVFIAVLFWLLMRPVRLEITETEVRARQGWARGQSRKNKYEALRGEIRSIHYCPSRISFRRADGEPLMEPVDIWTVRDMVKAAEELRVPLYDHRLGVFGVRELSAGRLVYDPESGLAARRERRSLTRS
jgi:hypothetical protein